MKNKQIYCPCGHAMIQRGDIFICTNCHSVFNQKEDGSFSFSGTTTGIRETRELLNELK